MTAYREAMSQFAEMGTMDIWYARLSEDELLQVTEPPRRRGQSVQAGGRCRRALGRRDPRQHAGAVQARRAGRRPVPDREPAAHRRPARDLAATYGMSSTDVETAIRDQLAGTAPPCRRICHLLERFQVIDIARKVVGVGSVGKVFIVSLQGRDERDASSAGQGSDPPYSRTTSPRSRHKQHGERVVHGQRMMQAARTPTWAGRMEKANRHFYWRQLRDMKGSADPETMVPLGLTLYARACGWTSPGPTPGQEIRRDRRPRSERPVRRGHHRVLRTLRRS